MAEFAMMPARISLSLLNQGMALSRTLTDNPRTPRS
jgi:hypothetical protein